MEGLLILKPLGDPKFFKNFIMPKTSWPWPNNLGHGSKIKIHNQKSSQIWHYQKFLKNLFWFNRNLSSFWLFVNFLYLAKLQICLQIQIFSNIVIILEKNLLFFSCVCTTSHMALFSLWLCLLASLSNAEEGNVHMTEMKKRLWITMMIVSNKTIIEFSACRTYKIS